MRLIDVDQIHHAKYHGIAEIYPSDVNIESYKRGWNDALDAVADPSCSPTIDAVPVVRCKDCIHSTSQVSDDEDTYFCNAHYHGVHSLEFCNHGERKES